VVKKKEAEDAKAASSLEVKLEELRSATEEDAMRRITEQRDIRRDAMEILVNPFPVEVDEDEDEDEDEKEGPKKKPMKRYKPEERPKMFRDNKHRKPFFLSDHDRNVLITPCKETITECEEKRSHLPMKPHRHRKFQVVALRTFNSLELSSDNFSQKYRDQMEKMKTFRQSFCEDLTIVEEVHDRKEMDDPKVFLEKAGFDFADFCAPDVHGVFQGNDRGSDDCNPQLGSACVDRTRRSARRSKKLQEDLPQLGSVFVAGKRRSARLM
jgi:hypothetical protein